MVKRPLYADNLFSSWSPAMANPTSDAERSSTSRSPVNTPTSTANSLPEQHSFAFEFRPTSPRAPPSASSATAETPRLTPSTTTTFTSGGDGAPPPRFTLSLPTSTRTSLFGNSNISGPFQHTPSSAVSSWRGSEGSPAPTFGHGFRSLSHEPPAASSTASNTPRLTPSTATFTENGERAPTSNFSFGSQPPSVAFFSWQGSERSPTATFRSGRTQSPSHAPAAASSTASGTPLFTPSSTPSVTREERASTPTLPVQDDDHDPDRPLPSVETETSTTRSRQDTSSTTVYTPSATTHDASPQQSLERGGLHQQLHDLNIASTEPADPPLQRHTSTPSIHVTSAPPAVSSSQHRESRTDSIVSGIDALRVGSSPRADTPSASEMRDSRSPTPSRRRRSGSAVAAERHSVENEDPPNSLFHMREIQDALNNTRSTALALADVLSSSELYREPESEIEGLHRRATNLSAFQPPSSRIVGLVGDTGVGKSSLINALLDKKEFARAGNSGRACTCVVSEYHYHDRDDFIIYVDYFSSEDLRRQFEELLQDYRNFQSLTPPRTTTAEEERSIYEDSRKKANLAEQTFRSSFGERITPAILLSLPFNRVLGMIVEWTLQLLPPQGSVDDSARMQYTFNTAEECSSRLTQLTSEGSEIQSGGEAQVCPWPFVRKLRVYLKAYILSKGLIIADLPGLRDSNTARKNITEQYLRDCHQILVVAETGRAIDDQSVHDVFELAEHAGLSRVDVVCTKSDDIQPEEAQSDYRSERATIRAMRRRVEADRQRINTLEANIEDLQQDLDDLSEEEMRELMRDQQEVRRVMALRDSHNFELLSHIINIRNNRVSEGLREKYGDHPTAAGLRAFCVSNKLYRDHRDEPAENALRYLRLSGILELRRHCIGIVAECHLRSTMKYIREDIPAFIGSLQIWVEAGSGNASAERRRQILRAVSAVQEGLDELTSPVSRFVEVSRNLRSEYNAQIHMRMRQSATHWKNGARQASMEWQGWPHQTYSAFCRRYGDYQTNWTEVPRCWNKEAIHDMIDDMSPIWESFEADLEAHFDRVKDMIKEAFRSIVEAAMSTTTEPQPHLRTLADTLGHHLNSIYYGVDDAIDDFRSELISLHTDAFSWISTSFIGQLMDDTYHATIMEGGTGSDRRRKNLITGRFGSASLFDEHRRRSKDSFRDMADGLEGKVRELVNQQVALIETDLQTMRNGNAILESERHPEFRNRVRIEVDRARAETERIGRVVDDMDATRGQSNVE